MEVAAETQNLLLAPVDALISHSAKRQNGVRVSGTVNLSGARLDHTTTEQRTGTAEQTIVGEPNRTIVVGRAR